MSVGNDIFGDLNKFYSTCRYYVSFGDAKSFQQFAQEQDQALRIYPWSSIAKVKPITVGPTIDQSVARQLYASKHDFASWGDVQLAVFVGGPDADNNVVRQLGEMGVKSVADYSELVKRMNGANYTSETKPNLALITTFLKDEQEAKSKNLGVLAVKAEREKKELAIKQAEEAKAEKERQARREARIKEFPYEAVLTCGMPDHINIVACFAKSGGVDTELVLKDGNSSSMYKAYNLQSAGFEDGKGFHINLRRGASLVAQNAHKTLILGLKVYDAKTGKLLHGDQVAQFGVVRFDAK